MQGFTAGMSRSTWSGVCVFDDCPVWGLTGKESGHVSAERCSGLDLSSCDRGPGYAAQGIHNQGIRSGISLLRLRGDVRATPPSSLCGSRILSAPPLCAPARVIPGRTLLGVKVDWLPSLPSTSSYAILNGLTAVSRFLFPYCCRPGMAVGFTPPRQPRRKESA